MKSATLALLASLALAAPALGQATATATPTKAGKATRLSASLDATQPPVSGRLPRETVLSIQSGYRFDGRAVAARCTAEQAAADACPPRSAIGDALVTAVYQGSDVPVPIELYLSKPVAGDVAGFAAVATILGQTYSVVGRVVRSAETPFGLSVILPTPGPDVSSFGITLKSFEADIGAMRTVRKGKRRVKRSLITNPRTCTAGTWASRAAFTFADGSVASLDAPIACVP